MIFFTTKQEIIKRTAKNSLAVVFLALFLFPFAFTTGVFAVTSPDTPDEVVVKAAEAAALAEAEAKAKADAEAKALQEKIAQKNAELNQIQNQIDTYSKWLNSAQDESKTLQGAIKTLDVERQKMNANISKTQNRIDSTSFTISELGITVSSTENKIKTSSSAIAEVIRSSERSESRSLVETILSKNKLSEILDETAQLAELREKIRGRLEELKSDKEYLLNQKNQKEVENKKLAGYKYSLVDQKKILDSAKTEKNNVLLATRNRESEYQRILRENQEKKEAFEKELSQYESQLTRSLDRKAIPVPRASAMLWPLNDVYITQHFGVTKDSVRLYASGSHNGTDLRASRGTSVTTPAPGVVIGVGNTDTTCSKASYGKWVLIRHDNGLTSLMAHFDLIKVVEGQQLSAGDLVGYSGNTGYSTGPHLHISLFASDGISVGSLPSQACAGKTFRIPLPTAKNAYLDPEAYFPVL